MFMSCNTRESRDVSFSVGGRTEDTLARVLDDDVLRLSGFAAQTYKVPEIVNVGASSTEVLEPDVFDRDQQRLWVFCGFDESPDEEEEEARPRHFLQHPRIVSY